MLTKNHETLTIEVKRHIEADAVLQGTYWNGSKGCFIGCLAHSDDASRLGELYGLPLPLVRICEYVFESLPADEAKTFFALLPEAVGRDGKDLTLAHWAFIASELRCLPKLDDDTQSVINTVIEGMELLASGGEWSRDAAARAGAAAYTAAYTAADTAARVAARAGAAAYGADTAGTAAYAAYAADTAADTAARAAAAAYAAVRADAAARAAYAAADAAARLRQRDTLLRIISEA